MNSEDAFKRKLETLRTLFLLLPPLNRFLLKKLIELLAVVADNLDNKMDAYNLGVVFAPNIICTRQVTFNYLILIFLFNDFILYSIIVIIAVYINSITFSCE